MKNLVWLLVLALFVLPHQMCSADWEQRLGKALVRPGQSVGNISLGLTRAAVLKKMGKPAYSSSFRGVYRDTWTEDDPDTQWIDKPFVTVLYSKNKVIQIDVKLTELFLSDYFSLNNTFAQLRKRFKGLKLIKRKSFSEENGPPYSFYYDDIRSGMGFFFIVDGKKVSPSNAPIYVSVHRKGHRMDTN